ncbi:MAG: GNAT family protein [Saprospiraceae bacterium]|nr:GNAT family protein [Saprospiraceae bacterium]
MNIRLRPLQETDNNAIAALINNKKILDNLMDRIPFPYTLADADFFIDLKQQESPQSTFAITDDSDTVLGVISLELKSDIYRYQAEIGYWIGEVYWGKGIASNAIRLMTAYGFDKLNLMRIVAGVFDGNTASMHVLRKNGYSQEAKLNKSVFKHGKFLDEYLFAKTKEA